MPFTFAHPAIILPLNYLPKNTVSMTGLVIGSMTPDFEYFLRMKIQSIYSHTLPGIFYFCLPIGLITTFLFHHIIKQPLLNNLPKFIGNRLNSIPTINWITHFKANWLVIFISIIIGASSHILWDGFTHSHGFFVEQFSYRATTFQLGEFKIPLYKLLQHSSTLVGLFCILAVIFRLPSKPIQKEVHFNYWLLVGSITAILTGIRFSMGLSFNLSGFGTLVATVIMTGFIGLTLTPFILKSSL